MRPEQLPDFRISFFVALIRLLLLSAASAALNCFHAGSACAPARAAQLPQVIVRPFPVSRSARLKTSPVGLVQREIQATKTSAQHPPISARPIDVDRAENRFDTEYPYTRCVARRARLMVSVRPAFGSQLSFPKKTALPPAIFSGSVRDPFRLLRLPGQGVNRTIGYRIDWVYGDCGAPGLLVPLSQALTPLTAPGGGDARQAGMGPPVVLRPVRAQCHKGKAEDLSEWATSQPDQQQRQIARRPMLGGPAARNQATASRPADPTHRLNIQAMAQTTGSREGPARFWAESTPNALTGSTYQDLRSRSAPIGVCSPFFRCFRH